MDTWAAAAIHIAVRNTDTITIYIRAKKSRLIIIQDGF